MSNRPEYPFVRRVVTGHDDASVAKVLVDGAATNERFPSPGMISTLVWSTDSMPAAIPVGETPEDMGNRMLGTSPPPSGSRFTILDFPPGNSAVVHRTETLDYVIVMEGEIDMDLDDSTVRLRAGDVLIQRGTNHAWVNRSDSRARIAVVLLDAEPLGIGHPIVAGATTTTSR